MPLRLLTALVVHVHAPCFVPFEGVCQRNWVSLLLGVARRHTVTEPGKRPTWSLKNGLLEHDFPLQTQWCHPLPGCTSKPSETKLVPEIHDLSGPGQIETKSQKPGDRQTGP